MCDPVPKLNDNPFFNPLSSRGFWTPDLHFRFREFALKNSARKVSSKDYLLAWLQEQAELSIKGCASSRSVFGILFTLAQRDTRECLEQIRNRSLQIELSTVNDSVVRDNVARWRRWLNESLVILSNIEAQLTSFVGAYRSDAQAVVSSTARWTSRFPDKQVPHPIPIGLYFQGPSIESEIAETRQTLEQIKDDIDLTRKIIEHTNESLRTSMSLVESKRAIAEAEGVTKLTELAFFIHSHFFCSKFFQYASRCKTPSSFQLVAGIPASPTSN